MKCIQCNNPETKVIESREVMEGSSIRRRRHCDQCKARFTTYERVERPYLAVIKKDGTRESFSRDKIIAGLQRASEKTHISGEQIEDLVASIENKLYQSGESEIKSSFIGELIMKGLKELDAVAYVRFASVYRHFRDISDFEQELSNLNSMK